MEILKNFLLFMLVWVSGCFLMDHVFMIDTRSYVMLWGYLVGVFAIYFSGLTQAIDKHFSGKE